MGATRPTSKIFHIWVRNRHSCVRVFRSEHSRNEDEDAEQWCTRLNEPRRTTMSCPFSARPVSSTHHCAMPDGRRPRGRVRDDCNTCSDCVTSSRKQMKKDRKNSRNAKADRRGDSYFHVERGRRLLAPAPSPEGLEPPRPPQASARAVTLEHLDPDLVAAVDASGRLQAHPGALRPTMEYSPSLPRTPRP